ncbi:MAG TPA: hypothetical protein VLM05_03600 [Mycobacteriales bacterium]|nr:hypothetical protein [Mycobacteriales bacterium]
MSTAEFLTVAGLGVFHGLNPAMGWLFAVALGLQASSDPGPRRAAALRALPPIAAGHLVSVGAVAAVFAVTASAVTSRAVTIGAGAVLVGMGLWRLLSQRHFRWVGMKLTPWELGTWSFLMSSVHGAGLMLVPVLATHHHAAVPASLGWSAVATTLVHTATMLLTAGGIAVLVLRVLGLGVLRRAWINVDRIWAVALIGAGAATALTH